jgi:hypothetical protein
VVKVLRASSGVSHVKLLSEKVLRVGDRFAVAFALEPEPEVERVPPTVPSTNIQKQTHQTNNPPHCLLKNDNKEME